RFLERDVLLRDWIVLLFLQLFRNVTWVLEGHVKIPGVGRADELDLHGIGALGHRSDPRGAETQTRPLAGRAPRYGRDNTWRARAVKQAYCSSGSAKSLSRLLRNADCGPLATSSAR